MLNKGEKLSKKSWKKGKQASAIFSLYKLNVEFPSYTEYFWVVTTKRFAGNSRRLLITTFF